MINRLFVVALAVVTIGSPLDAQPVPTPTGSRARAGGPPQERSQDRAQLERRFRENFAAEV